MKRISCGIGYDPGGKVSAIRKLERFRHHTFYSKMFPPAPYNSIWVAAVDRDSDRARGVFGFCFLAAARSRLRFRHALRAHRAFV